MGTFASFGPKTTKVCRTSGCKRPTHSQKLLKAMNLSTFLTQGGIGEVWNRLKTHSWTEVWVPAIGFMQLVLTDCGKVKGIQVMQRQGVTTFILNFKSSCTL